MRAKIGKAATKREGKTSTQGREEERVGLTREYSIKISRGSDNAADGMREQ